MSNLKIEEKLPAEAELPPTQPEILPTPGEASPTQGEASPTQGEASPTRREASLAQGEASLAQGEASLAQGEASLARKGEVDRGPAPPPQPSDITTGVISRRNLQESIDRRLKEREELKKDETLDDNKPFLAALWGWIKGFFRRLFGK